jgi:glycosyltransferase involved in cell wall biosynthesis
VSRVAYLVLSHRAPDQLARLARVLRDEDAGSLVVIHHDPTGPPLPADLTGDRILAFPDPRPVTWGDWSSVEAVIRPLRWLLDRHEFDWVAVISGQDYPVRPPSQIAADLAATQADALLDHDQIDVRWAGTEGRLRYLSRVYALPHLAFTQTVPASLRKAVRGAGFLAAERFTLLWIRSVRPMGRVLVGHRTSPPVPRERLQGGSDWFTLNRRAAEILVAETEHGGPLVEHFKRTLEPGEAYFHTVLANHPDLQVEPDNRRHIAFTGGSAHPTTVTAAEAERAARAGAHFARKFDLEQEPDALDTADRLRASPPPAREQPRVAVLVPCFNSGELIRETLASLREREPLELVVVDDASTDPATLALLDELRNDGVTVIRHEHNQGLAAARMTGLRNTHAPYVFPLDSDDLAVAGALAALADRLDAEPKAAACVADYQEFGTSDVLRAVPDRLDPYRIAFTNEYPVTSLFRRTALERAGGWREPHPEQRGYEDWNLWMTLAEQGEQITHLGPGRPGYRRRLHAPGLDAAARRHHADIYAALRAGHPRLFAALKQNRRASDLSPPRRALYPLVYGDRKLLRGEKAIKPWLDRVGIWTARR